MPAAGKEMNLSGAIVRALAPEIVGHIVMIGEAAAGLGFRAYLVGGCVRDLLLGRPGLDIDIGVEGDATVLGENVHAHLGAHLSSATVFGTTTLKFPDGLKIDLATARRETYARPAALPVVEKSGMADDLARRDFTINTLAILIGPDAFGRLIDPFGGVADLKAGLIRVLHDRSFIDDPTRILRAARFAGRFSFHLEKQTEKLARHAIRDGLPSLLSGKRLFTELKLILSEDDPARALRIAEKLGALDEYGPSLGGRSARKAVRLIDASMEWFGRASPQYKTDRIQARLIALLADLKDTQVEKFLSRVSITGDRAEKLLNEKRRLIGLKKTLHAAKRDSGVCRACGGLSIESLLFFRSTLRNRSDRMRLERYLTALRHVRPAVTGKDLLRMGYEPGPRLGKTLDLLLDAALDGVAATRAEQLELARRLLS